MNHIVLFVLDFEKVVTIIGSQEENRQGTLGQPVRMLGLLIAELLFCWLSIISYIVSWLLKLSCSKCHVKLGVENLKG